MSADYAGYVRSHSGPWSMVSAGPSTGTSPETLQSWADTFQTASEALFDASRNFAAEGAESGDKAARKMGAIAAILGVAASIVSGKFQEAAIDAKFERSWRSGDFGMEKAEFSYSLLSDVETDFPRFMSGPTDFVSQIEFEASIARGGDGARDFDGQIGKDDYGMREVMAENDGNVA